jgi:hypothetical protein
VNPSGGRRKRAKLVRQRGTSDRLAIGLASLAGVSAKWFWCALGLLIQMRGRKIRAGNALSRWCDECHSAGAGVASYMSLMPNLNGVLNLEADRIDQKLRDLSRIVCGGDREIGERYTRRRCGG